MGEPLPAELTQKFERVNVLLAETFTDAPGVKAVCLTWSFQAEDVLLAKLALQ